jgi:hypothetical protein
MQGVTTNFHHIYLFFSPSNAVLSSVFAAEAITGWAFCPNHLPNASIRLKDIFLNTKDRLACDSFTD